MARDRETGSRDSADELVSHTMYRAEMYRARRIFFKFLAEFQDMVVDGASRRIILVAPNLVQQLVTANHPVGILHKKLEGLELLRRQDHDLPVALDLHLFEVHGDTVEAENLHLRRAHRVADSRSDPRQQLPRTKRLGYVIVGA